MCDFQRMVAETCATAVLATDAQLERVALLHGAASVTVSAPECDDTGRFWFFLSGTVRGEPISVPHVVSATLGRVVNAPRLMEAYRRGIADELRHRGFPVAAEAISAREEPI